MSVSTGREVLEKREKRIGRWDEATGHHRREHPPTPQCPNEPPSRGDSPLPGVQRRRQALLLHPRRIPLPQGSGNPRDRRLLLRLPSRGGLELQDRRRVAKPTFSSLTIIVGPGLLIGAPTLFYLLGSMLRGHAFATQKVGGSWFSNLLCFVTICEGVGIICRRGP